MENNLGGASCSAQLETARFCYYAAVVVRKNFAGEDCAYIDSGLIQVRQEVYEHYGASISEGTKAQAEASGWNYDSRRAAAEGLIQSELDAGYPVLFYADGSFKHYMVIDGYGTRAGGGRDFYVHVNFGFGGGGGWYSLWEDMDVGSVTFSHSRNFFSVRPGLWR